MTARHRTWRSLQRRLVCLVAWCAIAGVAPLSAQPSAGSDRVLVMPFENVTQDGKIVWLSEAAAVLLADGLNSLGLQAIGRDERQEAFDRLQVPPAAALTDATVLRLGQLVGATTVVVGSVRLDGDVLVAEARSIVLDAARLRQRASERGPLNELFATFSRIARQLVPQSAPAGNDLELPHPPVAAFESYIKGLLAENPKTAVTYLRAALDASPSYDRARLALWDAFTLQGDHKAAVEVLDGVPGTSPLNTRARFLAGLSYISLQRFDEAFDLYQRLAERHPTAAVFNNLGVVQLRRGSHATGEPATSLFAKAAELDPSDPGLFFNLGYAYWALRDSGSAIHWLREAVRRNPADGEAHYVLGAALTLGGDRAQSDREKELARRLSSTFADWDKRPASEPVPKGLERIRDDVALPIARRQEDSQASGRDQQALVSFHVDRGRRLYERELDREAAVELNRALFLSPYHPEANLLIGRVHQRSGRLAEAIGSFKISLWSAETAAAHAALASAYLDVEDHESARNEATQALEVDPQSADAKRILDRLAALGR